MSSLGDMIDDMWIDAGDAGTSGSGCFWFVVLLIGGAVIGFLGANGLLPW